MDLCWYCKKGIHEKCVTILCGCLHEHDNDDDIDRHFKELQRVLHPESHVKGGWYSGGADSKGTRS